MEKNNEFIKFGITNGTCYYFDDLIIMENFDFDNILLNEKSYGSILIYKTLSKTLTSEKLLRIIYNKVHESVVAIYYKL